MDILSGLISHVRGTTIPTGMRVGSGLSLTMTRSAISISTLLIGRCSTSMRPTVCLRMKISSYYSFMRQRNRSSMRGADSSLPSTFIRLNLLRIGESLYLRRADYRLILNTDDTAYRRLWCCRGCPLSVAGCCDRGTGAVDSTLCSCSDLRRCCV